ncbi:type II toxin-antitoxin system HipA family toxin [soil metagenome]
MKTALIKIWDELAGAVLWDENEGIATFEYDQKFKNLNWDLAPLRMSIYSEKSVFSFPSLRKRSDPLLDTFKGLPGLLADSLPDKYGNQLINTWLALQGRPPDSMNPVEMLCFIGGRGMGALEFEVPILNESKKTFSVEIDSLVKVAQELLNQKQSFYTDLNANKKKALLEILRIGTSAGGARPKAVIAYNEATGEVRSGQTIAPKGFEHWLIKLDGVSDIQLGASKGYGRVEMAYYNMAAACGIEMMPSKLLEENDRAHFMTKRFDREDGSTKHHIQSFCAMKHFDYNEVTSFSYEQLFQTMRELKLTYSETEQMFRRMVFNVIARNCDDHTKNFSFRMKKDKKWELAPAYDICHAYQPNHRWVSQHALSINGKRENILRDDLLILGKSIKNKKAAFMIDEINDIVKNWKKYADEVKVSPVLRDEISKTLIVF